MNVGDQKLNIKGQVAAVPGIHLRIGRISEDHQSTVQGEGRHCVSAKLSTWLTARVESRYASAAVMASHESGVQVLFEGYLSEISGSHDPALDYPALSILTMYIENGLEFLIRLRGSYACLIIDPRVQQAFLFNDRRGSRPLFMRRDRSDEILFGPEVGLLAASAPALRDVDPVAVAEFLTFASYYDRRTLFRGIEKVAGGSLVTLKPDGISVDNYWKICLEGKREFNSFDVLVDEGVHLFGRSIERLMRGATKPFLFLSGGVDSRMILGGFRARGGVAAAAYGTPGGDDADIARVLAERCDLPFRYFPISTDELQDYFTSASIDSDGRAETIDTPSIGAITGQLAQEFGFYMQGDKSFYGKPASTAEEALDAAGVFSLRKHVRLHDKLSRDVARLVAVSMDESLERMVCGSSSVDANDLRDKIYYEQRLANRQNAFAAAGLRRIENGRPWLDEDLVDFFFSIPGALRASNKVGRAMLERAYPDLAAVGFAQRDSIPHANTYRQLVPQNEVLAEFLRVQFNECLDSRLAEIFVRTRLLREVESLLLGSEFPLGVGFLYRLPGAWRLFARRYQGDRVHPVSVLLRLTQLNLYLQYVDGLS